MKTHRGPPLWIAGRIGILVVFGILPMERACNRIKNPPYDTTRWKYALSNANAALNLYNPEEFNKWITVAQEEEVKVRSYNSQHFGIK